MKKLLIIGGTGFVGSHIVKHFQYKQNIVATGSEFDVRKSDIMLKLINREKPDNIINLASITTLKESIKKPNETFDINFGGTRNLLTVLEKTNFTGSFLYVSSSEVYGLLKQKDLPVNESKLTKPQTPYAVSKIATEALCLQVSQQSKFKIVVARPFNHIGPGQSDRFSIADFAKQITKIKLGLMLPILKAGDIDTTRDFSDVRDIVSAYDRIIEFGNNGEIYNVCSGKELSIRSIIQLMSQLSDVNVEVVKDQERFRNSDQRHVCGDNNKLKSETGWFGTFEIKQTLHDILKDWEFRIKSN